MDDVMLGVDLGGTNLRVGVVRADGAMLDFAARPIDGTAPGEAIVSEVVRLARTLPHAAQASGVGLGIAAVIYPDGLIRKEMVNLPGMDRFPLRLAVEQAFGLPAVVENDALTALVGEHRFGAGQGIDDILLLTLGTGVGGALLLNGVLRRGPHGLGSEVGLIPFPDPDLERWTEFERLASPKAIMRSLGDPDGNLYALAASGSAAAAQAIQRMYAYLGWLIVTLHLAADFRLVILSGGLAAVGQPLEQGVMHAFRRLCPAEVQFDLQVRVGALPAQAAGVLGAAALAFDSI